MFLILGITGFRIPAGNNAEWNEYIQVVLDSLPLYLGRAHTGQLSEQAAENLLVELDERGIGIFCPWEPEISDEAISSCLTLARAQQILGLRVNIDGIHLLDLLYNGDQRTAHIDQNGDPFFDDLSHQVEIASQAVELGDNQRRII